MIQGPRLKKAPEAACCALRTTILLLSGYSTLLAKAGLPVAELTAWNAYPWYLNRKPTAAELEVAAEPLHRLRKLLPRLRVVLVHGGDAQDGWRRFKKQYPADAQGISVVATYHTSRQAFWHADPEVRKQRLEKLRSDLSAVVGLLAEEDRLPGTSASA